VNADELKVLIVEDHLVVAEGLSSLLAEYPELRVVGIVPSVAEAVRAAESACPDIGVIDFRLPDGSGADAAHGIRAVCPSATIVFLSADDSDEALIAAVEAGAAGYLLKSSGGAEIAQAIRRAAGGETLISATTLAAVLARRREASQVRTEQARTLRSLTPREQEILVLMTQGLDNRAIATQLGVSYATVRTHVHKILAKLDVRSRLEAVAKVTDWDLEQD